MILTYTQRTLEYKKNIADILKQNRDEILSYNLTLTQASIKFLNSIGFKSFKGYKITNTIMCGIFTTAELKEILGVNTEDPIEILKRNREKILRMNGSFYQRYADILNESGNMTEQGNRWNRSRVHNLRNKSVRLQNLLQSLL